MPWKALVRALRKQDEKAYEILFELCYDSVWRAAYLVTLDPELARDAAQEAFVKVFRAIDGLRDPGHFRRWLHTLATNAAIDLVRRRCPERSLGDDADEVPSRAEEVLAGQGSLPELAAIRAEQRAVIRAALRELPPIYRQALLLHYYRDLSVEQIATELSVPVGTIKSRLHRGRSYLAAALIRRQRAEVSECEVRREPQAPLPSRPGQPSSPGDRTRTSGDSPEGGAPYA